MPLRAARWPITTADGFWFYHRSLIPYRARTTARFGHMQFCTFPPVLHGAIPVLIRIHAARSLRDAAPTRGLTFRCGFALQFAP